MNIKPIHNDHDYQEALKRIESLLDAKIDTPEGDELDVLTTLVEAYERRMFPVDIAEPVEALQFYLKQNGLSPADLMPMIGKMNRVYEILNRKRPLSLRMIRNLHEKCGIPAQVLIKESILS